MPSNGIVHITISHGRLMFSNSQFEIEFCLAYIYLATWSFQDRNDMHGEAINKLFYLIFLSRMGVIKRLSIEFI